jgi:hypothetical protein
MTRLPRRREVLVVAAVLLVALAGCSGLSSSGTPTADATEPGTATETTSVASPDTPSDVERSTREAGDSTGDGSDDPAGSVETNVTGADLDGAALNDATAAAVEAAGSYTLQSNTVFATRQSTGSSLTQTTTTTRVDLEANTGIRVSDQTVSSPRFEQNTSRVVYTEDNVSYQKLTSSRGSNYSSQEGEATGLGGINTVNVTGYSQNLRYLSDGLVWQDNGTETVDGVTTTRYTLAGLSNVTAFTGNTTATITDMSGTLLVDDDDVVRRTAISYTAETRRGTTTVQFRFDLVDVGSTTVEEPDWTSRAESSDSSS